VAPASPPAPGFEFPPPGLNDLSTGDVCIAVVSALTI
jgi:hypothetical protein